MAAALMAMTPMGRRVSLNSIMIRPRIGSAVMENAVAMNSAEARRSTPGDSSGAVNQPKPKPSANGAIMLALAMAVTARRWCRSPRCAKSNSRPIWNISKIKPSCDSICIGADGVE